MQDAKNRRLSTIAQFCQAISSQLRHVEIVFHRPNVCHDLLPPIMHSVSRVIVAKLLGVHLRHDLNFSQQVESVVATCNQRLSISTA